jgi:hypothetical protein
VPLYPARNRRVATELKGSLGSGKWHPICDGAWRTLATLDDGESERSALPAGQPLWPRAQNTYGEFLATESLYVVQPTSTQVVRV